MKNKRIWIAVAATLLLVAHAGCGDAGYGGGYGGEFGATQGGVQDMGLARALIDEGQVPPSAAFPVEGMFSEHDLPVDGAPCAGMLCVRTATGIAPDLEGTERAWLQLGLSSTINPDTYERPSLSIVATVDISGSMGWNYGPERDTPASLSLDLLRRIAAELGPDDRFSIVTYGSSVNTRFEPRAATDQAEIQRAIDSLGEGGSTNMEAGLRRAFSVADDELGQADEVRVLLFTDVQPNVGATSASEFGTMTAAAADNGVGLTVFGTGVGLGQELMNAMAHLRRGNAFSVMESSDVPDLMEESWPWMASPIAFDLHVDVTPSEATEVRAGYGFPGPSADGASTLDAATVFLSRRRGALLIELATESTDAADIPIEQAGAQVRLSYERVDGTPVEQILGVGWASMEIDERGHGYQQASTGRTVALALMVTGMRLAAESYEDGNEAAAIEQMASVLARIEADAAALADPALTAEVELARELSRLIESGAPQGSLYGR